ncbi:CCDC149 [Branchiostoma lanceolatum]|uniref:CCDC149 protein n=1 Tax=Branchiostoma lanceolatum TaxID=7740 RepID=A0A8J9ZMQ8_BRALA|nr:CCDC149 [Branchiostoma lanceolatum]
MAFNRPTEAQCHMLVNEYQACKRKLESKKEALVIMARELENTQKERDQFKLMADQLRERYQTLRKRYEEKERRDVSVFPHQPKSPTRAPDSLDPAQFSDTRSKSLAQLLSEARTQNKRLLAEGKDLTQKLTEAQGDIKMLRESLARMRVGDEGVGNRHFPKHEREDLVKQLEEARERTEVLERDVQALSDEKEEMSSERNFHRDRAERLNEELNYILRGDEKRIVDIDALRMENKYLQERVKQAQEEKSLLQTTIGKYKQALDRRKGKGILKIGANRTGGVVVSQKQVQQLLDGRLGSIPATPSSVADLQSLAASLVETINDKNMALQHQRNTNKILGNRVNELEKKLKTLEVSGLWSLPGRETGDKAQMGQGLEALIPKKVTPPTRINPFNFPSSQGACAPPPGERQSPVGSAAEPQENGADNNHAQGDTGAISPPPEPLTPPLGDLLSPEESLSSSEACSVVNVSRLVEALICDGQSPERPLSLHLRDRSMSSPERSHRSRRYSSGDLILLEDLVSPTISEQSFGERDRVSITEDPPSCVSDKVSSMSEVTGQQQVMTSEEPEPTGAPDDESIEVTGQEDAAMVSNVSEGAEGVSTFDQSGAEESSALLGATALPEDENFQSEQQLAGGAIQAEELEGAVEKATSKLTHRHGTEEEQSSPIRGDTEPLLPK